MFEQKLVAVLSVLSETVYSRSKAELIKYYSQLVLSAKEMGLTAQELDKFGSKKLETHLITDAQEREKTATREADERERTAIREASKRE